MIYPSIGELTKDGKINRYELVIATAKCARKITDEYVAQRELAERAIANKKRFPKGKRCSDREDSRSSVFRSAALLA